MNEFLLLEKKEDQHLYIEEEYAQYFLLRMGLLI